MLTAQVNGLGSMIPSEADLAKRYGYWPVMTGWVRGDAVGGLAGPLRLGQNENLPGVPAGGYAQEYMMLQRRNSRLQLASTIAVLMIAGVAIVGVVLGGRR